MCTVSPNSLAKCTLLKHTFTLGRVKVMYMPGMETRFQQQTNSATSDIGIEVFSTLVPVCNYFTDVLFDRQNGRKKYPCFQGSML